MSAERKCFVVVREQWCGQGPTEDWEVIAVYTLEPRAEARATVEKAARPKGFAGSSNDFRVVDAVLVDDGCPECGSPMVCCVGATAKCPGVAENGKPPDTARALVAEIDRRLALHDQRSRVLSVEGAGGYRLALEELRRHLTARSV